MSPVFMHLLRYLAILILMSSWYYGIWLLAIPLTLWYAYSYPAYELIALGLLIDIQFYTGDFMPYYGLSAIVLVVCFRLGVPLFRSHTDS